MTPTPETDRELLELAAKAAGYAVTPHPNRRLFKGLVFVLEGSNWNPLTDDGDALRLAIKLGITVTPYPIYENPKHSVIADIKIMNVILREGAAKEKFHVEIYGSDPYAATRRAITKVAAEIGKSMP